MKSSYKKKIIIVLSFVLAIVSICVAQFITKAKSNVIITPSRPSGYYDSTFTLEFNKPYWGWNIYYTTDGSRPTKDSMKYEGGIELSNVSDRENVYNSIVNVVPNYLDENPVASDKVEKGNIIRAIMVSPFGKETDSFTGTYFIGLERPSEEYVFSIVFDYDDFFGPDGMYVTGSEYDEWYTSSDRTGEEPIPNFLKQIEKKVNVEVIDSLGVHVLNQDMGCRIQGDSQRRFAKKRLSLFAREEYSGKDNFDISLFDNYKTHSVMFKNSWNDVLTYELYNDRDVAIQQGKTARVYLNGEFWYSTFVFERFDNQYFKQHYDVPKSVRVKNMLAVEEDQQYIYDELKKFLKSNSLDDEYSWMAANEMIDVQSYIDFLAINYLLCNVDFSELRNTIMWRSQSVTEGYNDGRWRWCIYDVDSIEWAKKYYEDIDKTAEIDVLSWDFPWAKPKLNENDLYIKFMENENFSRLFVLSFMDILNNNFTEERIDKAFKKINIDESWKTEYFDDRKKNAQEHLAQAFGLSDKIDTIMVECMEEQGRVKVNSSYVDLSKGGWSGEYFEDFPVEVTVHPKAGYMFVGWDVYGNQDDTAIDRMAESIKLNVTENLRIVANFEEVQG